MRKDDKADFAAFCRAATDTQIRNIYGKELSARRRAYAAIALAEIQKRGLA